MGKVFLKLDMEKGGRPHWDGMRIGLRNKAAGSQGCAEIAEAHDEALWPIAAHAAFPDTEGKFAVLSRKFPVLLRREFRRNPLICSAENGPLYRFWG